MSSLALLEAEIPSPLFVTGKKQVHVFFGIDGGCCCLSFMYKCGGSDGVQDGAILNKRQAQDDSLNWPIVGEGVRGGPVLTPPQVFFSSCSKSICWAQGSPKTDFVFTPNTIFHIVSHLCDHLDRASYLKFVEFVVPLFCLVLLKFNPKSYKICFTAYLSSQIIQKRRQKIITHNQKKNNGHSNPLECIKFSVTKKQSKLLVREKKSKLLVRDKL